jgi:3-phosphoshikimate 1-carboxyvinyltransferase
MHFIVQPSIVANAAIAVPGDKSISHRGLMLGGVARGRTRITGFLAGADCLATLAAMEAMGVSVRHEQPTEVVVDGVGLGGLHAPAVDLDLGNSGTAMRLMTGLLCGQPFDAVLTGDTSLTGRPMQRVITPLEAMGAAIESRDGRPPLTVRGGHALHGIDYVLPVASAQVKSALLLAGLQASGVTRVVEPAVTRDHTERMLRSMSVEVVTDGNRIGIAGGQQPVGCDVQVPADLSSAAFPMLAALIAGRADVTIRDVGVNPTRTGAIDILRGMGADIRLENPRHFGDEPVADLRIRSSSLKGGAVDPGLVSLAIDEFPVLFVAAAAARGSTVFTGIGELRVKESDRIAAMASGLRALGIEVEEWDDGAVVHGGRFHGGTVESRGDHRIAMALAVAATIADTPVTVRDVDAVDTSFPDFAACLQGLGVDIRVGDDRAA